MNLFRVLFLSLLLFYLGLCHVVEARDLVFSPGFRTIGVWDEGEKIRLDLNVWYPTKVKPKQVYLKPWTLNIAHYAIPVSGRFPLIILSHDTVATRFSYHQSAALFASMGFVVIAPEHQGDNLHHMNSLFKWQQLEQRIREIIFLLDLAQKHEKLKSMVDMERVGLLGFGTGASVALLLAGALFDIEGFNNYCSHVPQSNMYCNAWSKKHVQNMIASLPMEQISFRDSRIKAIGAVAPAYDFLFTPKVLQNIVAPLLLVETEKDLKQKIWGKHNIQEIFPDDIDFICIDKIDKRDFMSTCPSIYTRDLPDLCGSANEELRSAVHEEFNSKVIEFFLFQLGKKS